MYCICCKKDNVKPLIFSDSSPKSGVRKVNKTEEEILWTDFDRVYNGGQKYTSTIDNEMIDGGIIQIVTAGFGSKHDSDKFIIAICDDCIQSNLDDATLLLFESSDYTNDAEVEKSKKIYRRRKRLDDLTGEE